MSSYLLALYIYFLAVITNLHFCFQNFFISACHVLGIHLGPWHNKILSHKMAITQWNTTRFYYFLFIASSWRKIMVVVKKCLSVTYWWHIQVNKLGMGDGCQGKRECCCSEDPSLLLCTQVRSLIINWPVTPVPGVVGFLLESRSTCTHVCLYPLIYISTIKYKINLKKKGF